MWLIARGGGAYLEAHSTPELTGLYGWLTMYSTAVRRFVGGDDKTIMVLLGI